MLVDLQTRPGLAAVRLLHVEIDGEMGRTSDDAL
jgi:hypothetical protein